MDIARSGPKLKMATVAIQKKREQLALLAASNGANPAADTPAKRVRIEQKAAKSNGAAPQSLPHLETPAARIDTMLADGAISGEAMAEVLQQLTSPATLQGAQDAAPGGLASRWAGSTVRQSASTLRRTRPGVQISENFSEDEDEEDYLDEDAEADAEGWLREEDADTDLRSSPHVPSAARFSPRFSPSPEPEVQFPRVLPPTPPLPLDIPSSFFIP